jgi:hypothetical protein
MEANFTFLEHSSSVHFPSEIESPPNEQRSSIDSPSFPITVDSGFETGLEAILSLLQFGRDGKLHLQTCMILDILKDLIGLPLFARCEDIPASLPLRGNSSTNTNTTKAPHHSMIQSTFFSIHVKAPDVSVSFNTTTEGENTIHCLSTIRLVPGVQVLSKVAVSGPLSPITDAPYPLRLG